MEVAAHKSAGLPSPDDDNGILEILIGITLGLIVLAIVKHYYF